MSLSIYQRLKNRFESVKPIRGRAVECRPIGDRRRDWEQIVKVLTPMGESYGARLYDTDCVVVAPNGDMYLTIDRWATPLTAQWIQRYSGLPCYKKYNAIWIEVDGRTIPISKGEKLHLQFKGENMGISKSNWYSCDKQVVKKQKVIDRAKIKEVRDTIKEFRNFAKTMVTLADGWISEELLKQHRVFDDPSLRHSSWTYHIGEDKFNQWDLRGSRMTEHTAKKLVAHMQTATEQDMVKLMLMVIESCPSVTRRAIRQETRSYNWNGGSQTYTESVYEYQYDPKAVVGRIDYIIKKANDVFTEKEVVVDKPMTNLL